MRAWLMFDTLSARPVLPFAGLLILAEVVCAHGAVPQTRTQEKSERGPGETASPLQSAKRSEWKLKEPEGAVAGARAILGLPAVKSSNIHAKLVVLKEDPTPYLREQIINRPIWQVTIKDWSVRLPCYPEGVSDPFKRTLDVYVDPVDGKLLKLETRWPEGEPHLIGPRPSAETAAQQIRGGGGERYYGFPSEPPEVSFLDALDAAVARGGAKPFVARQIFGHYVIQSCGLHKPTPVWAITLWGIPPYHLPGRAETNEPVFVLRYIVDGETGQWRSHVTTPHPTEYPDKHD